ncbi:MAG TPA: hypothetical protein VGK73_32505 [Polyangiaceae bacterium]
MSVIGWAVLNSQGQIDSYYDSADKAKRRAQAMAQSGDLVTVAEMRVLTKIRAHRPEWVYTEYLPVEKEPTHD